MKLAAKILAFIPLVIELLLLIATANMGDIVLVIHTSITILLATIAISVISNKKIIQRVGFGAVVILTALFCIMGYYDYVQGFTLSTGIILLIYFIFIRMAIRIL